jgi:hypothetical protein
LNVARAFRPEGLPSAGNYFATRETLTPEGVSYKIRLE